MIKCKLLEFYKTSCFSKKKLKLLTQSSLPFFQNIHIFIDFFKISGRNHTFLQYFPKKIERMYAFLSDFSKYLVKSMHFIDFLKYPLNMHEKLEF